MCILRLFKRLVIISMLFVSVASEVTIIIIFSLIMESDQVVIAYLLSNMNRSSIMSDGL